MTVDTPQDDIFPVVRAGDINHEPVSQSWLIEDLWTASSVGWVAGSPKSLKSWVALEMAVSVASGSACLGRYQVPRPGRVLVYLAEDSLAAVRERLEALVHRREVSMDDLDVHIVTVSRMRLDLGRDQVRLRKTLRAYAPRLLVLDPLVRLHRADENSSADISALLAYLRELQRELDLSVLVVHHSRKNGATGSQGQGLRGSGDLWAWSDSALYLKRKSDEVALTIEHRAAPAPAGVTLRLASEEDGPPRLEIIAGTRHSGGPPVALEERVLQALGEAATPTTRGSLREKLAVKNERLGRALRRLHRDGVVKRTARGWSISATTFNDVQDRSPLNPIGFEGNGTIDDPENCSLNTAQEETL
jgi:hypothetical protein